MASGLLSEFRVHRVSSIYAGKTCFRYFSLKSESMQFEAREESRGKKVSSDVVSLWVDPLGQVFEVHAKKVFVDLPDRESVLAKLTSTEKFVLGVE